MSESTLQQLIQLFRTTHERLHRKAARSVDVALVVRNWLFGLYIVEFENGAASRSGLYGKALISRLAAELKQQGLKGVSATNLKQCRSFYLAYPQIGQTPSDASATLVELKTNRTGHRPGAGRVSHRRVQARLVPLCDAPDSRQLGRTTLLRDRSHRQ